MTKWVVLKSCKLRPSPRVAAGKGCGLRDGPRRLQTIQLAFAFLKPQDPVAARHVAYTVRKGPCNNRDQPILYIIFQQLRQGRCRRQLLRGIVQVEVLDPDQQMELYPFNQILPAIFHGCSAYTKAEAFKFGLRCVGRQMAHLKRLLCTYVYL